MKKTKYDSPAFLKISATAATHSPLFVRAEEILNVDYEGTLATSIHLAGGSKIILTHPDDSTAKSIQGGIYSALQTAFNRRGSLGEAFTVAVSSTVSVTSYAFA